MFKERLLELRKNNKMTQEELATNLNVSKQTVGSWERGRTEPSIEIIVTLAKLLNTTVDYLLGKTNIPTDNSSENKLAKNLNTIMKTSDSDTLQLYLKLLKLTPKELIAIENIIDIIIKEA
jgi:transcriptional regulator with XRE-family HTH domain